MSWLRSLWRCCQLLAMFVYAGAELLLVRPRSRAARAEWLHAFCARAIRRLDVQITVSGEFPARGALISNHLSYLDIVIYAALHPCVFVAKAEIESWPVVGWMTTMAGTVYVQRGRGGSAKRALGSIDDILKDYIPLLFFPEGTTSSGDGVLRFHAGLLGPIIAGKQPLKAAFIRYHLPESTSAETLREDVHFWGETPMLRHIFRLLSLRGIRAEVAFADRPMQFLPDPPSRKEAAVQARQAVCTIGGVDPDVIPSE